MPNVIAKPERVVNIGSPRACDLCQESPAAFDSPIVLPGRGSTWAYTCEDCYPQFAAPSAAALGCRVEW
jgi:hypothetical protein